MNVDEIISYQPTSSVDDSQQQNDHKLGQNKDKYINDILQQNTMKQYNFLDDNWVNKMIIQFDRKLIKNQEKRIKYANEPTNFLNSEIELFDMLQEMHALPAVPEFYDVLIENRVINNLLGLLDHENIDIVVAVINLLFEFSDNESESENLDKEQLMSQALIDNQIIKCIISVLQRLDENVKEERDAVNNALTIIESLTDYDPDCIKDSEQLIIWILQRLKSKLPFNENKLSACEILSIILQIEQSNKTILAAHQGIDTLLQQIALYKKNEPESVSEQEYVENLFVCLCSSLLDCNENRKLFFEGEGIELMNIILRDKQKKGKKAIRSGALKVLDYLFVNNDQDNEFLESCSNRLIEILGLKAIFPIFMLPKSIVSTKRNYKNDEEIEKIEEYSLLIILTLIKYSKKSNRQRCLYKFVENNYEKIERLVELYFKYADKMIRCEQQINKEKIKMDADDQEIDEEAFFLKRLSVGLLSLQLISQLIVILCSDDVQKSISELIQIDEDLKSRIMKQINMRASQTNHYKFIKKFVQEVINDEKNDAYKQHLQSLLDEF